MPRVMSVLLAALYCVAYVSAQLVTATLEGTVVDSSKSAIPSVSVRLVSEATGAIREASSDEHGHFEFTAIQPGIYVLIVEHSGFKKYERTKIEIEPNDRLSAGEVQLELGSVAQMVTVESRGSMIQTASAERSGIITSEQIQDLTVINRDFAALAALQPGVVAEGGEVQGFGGDARFNVLGGRGNANSITIDGVPSDNSNGSSVNTFISEDAVSSVKILTSNFQAEFGRKPAASIMAVTKSGGSNFHGTMYVYHRNEKLYANDFLSNARGLDKQPSRYDTLGVSVGGPVYIPGVFNRDRQKLFFFFSSEEIRERRRQPIREVTVPTLLERNGDFSQSFDNGGKLILIKDPRKTGTCGYQGNVQVWTGCFGDSPATNRIPTDQGLIHPLGQKYLNLLPRPDPNLSGVANSRGNFNYQFRESLNIPKRQETVRIDHSLSQDTKIYGRFSYFWEDIQGASVPAGNANWGLLPNDYNDISRTLSLSASHVFSPTLVLEASMGASHWTETSGPGLKPEYVQRLTRAATGINIPQFHPENNPLGLIPQAEFGVTNSANLTYNDRFPIRGHETLMTWNAALTRVHHAHTSKAGFYSERWWENKGPDANFAGKFRFNNDVNNPNNAGYGYANALLGNFQNYSEATNRAALVSRVLGVEWFVQDNWKVSPKLTLDYGVRFGWSQPFHSPGLDEAGFLPDRYDPLQRAALIQAARQGNRRVGVNDPAACQLDPVTLRLPAQPPSGCRVFSAEEIGAFVPGVGDRFNGTVNRQLEPGYPVGLRNASGVKTAPRFGFAYDPFGKGKTAIRGGAGVFYEIHERDNLSANIFRNPPLKLDPTIHFGNLDSFMNLDAFNTPSDTSGFDPHRPLQRIVNFSLGIQQDVGFGTVVDISYVGALGRHLAQRRNLNSLPFGTNFLPQNRDATLLPRNVAKSSAFLRPYLGYNNIWYSEYTGNSSYHSLQVQADRRFSKGLNFGVAWTWSKAMDYADNETGNNPNTSAVSSLINWRSWNYGKGGMDRTHIVKAHGAWDLPKASHLWNAGIARKVFDDWTLSGTATFQSGAPKGIMVGFASGSGLSGTEITGSPSDGPRVVVVGDPILPKDQRTFGHNFDTEAFRMPAIGSVGNAAKDVIRGPGTNNWDLSLFKRIPLPGERWKMQLRAEFYNAFNHTQFSDLENMATFDGQSRQTNKRFGEFTKVRQPRRIQLALRLSF